MPPRLDNPAHTFPADPTHPQADAREGFSAVTRQEGKPDNLVCGVCGKRINRVVYFTDADAKPFCSVACLRKDYPLPLNLMTPNASSHPTLPQTREGRCAL